MLILIVANKDWEAEPLVNVLRHPKARPKSLSESRKLPSIENVRLVIEGDGFVAEVLCISDFMDKKAHSSSTAEKAKVLENIFERVEPTIVVAFGTGSYPGASSYNGCVSMGTKTYIHNAYPKKSNPESNWDHPDTGRLIDSSLGEPLFRQIKRTSLLEAEARFVSPPINSAKQLFIFSAYENVGLGVVNITNYSDYHRVDREALDAFAESDSRSPIGSVETTHGVIHMLSSAPFLFVTGIANRLGYFSHEAAPRKYAQDFAAAHNAAVTMAWILPDLAAHTIDKPA